MGSKLKVGVLLGSLRKAGTTRKLYAAMKQLEPAGLDLQLIEIGHLPLFNGDTEKEGTPPEWTAFREQAFGVDAFLFITPEYNRSVPAALKNALEIGSRPYQDPAVSRKPAAVATFSPGTMGGFGANHHLRQILVFLDIPVLAQPEIYLGSADKLFDEQGQLSSQPVRDLLTRFLIEFEGFAQRNQR